MIYILKVIRVEFDKVYVIALLRRNFNNIQCQGNKLFVMLVKLIG